MNEEITTFLNSGLLEKYLIGETTASETDMVENLIVNNAAVKTAYDVLQDNLEVVSKLNAKEAPQDALNNILDALDEKPVISISKINKRKTWYKYSIAASVAAFLFASTSYLFYVQNQKLSHENQVVVDEIFDLRSDIENNNKMLSDIMKQFKQLNNPETRKYIINGNSRAKNLKTVAYINPKEKKSMIDVVSLPQLPEDQCYQIWAEVEDKMVNLGILKETDRQLKEIPYTEDALALSITIEPKGVNPKASKENAVAEIALHNIK
ncbi:anti-sigma factor [Hanstruepera marina]|uniref:anti-sigma factor n=1 Tax=Hanstruepera marina TaxID=2873265 RepID=UPI001CA619A3|nr:anti-sigma factor [Hanstruepera marina]